MTSEDYIKEQDGEAAETIIKASGIITKKVREIIDKELDNSHKHMKKLLPDTMTYDIFYSLVVIAFQHEMSSKCLQDLIDTTIKMEYLSLKDLKSNFKKLWNNLTGEEF